ncbi:hypothetical protein OOZ19_02785 [Saccharopolyspora sp. NFXS83]|uniref:hypothetical protein n=1 Tax=Saccharopolyspora sp. NFXS83 TaxID=2993560 RepID=UPI00224B343F|nr:hypothetical protein [Saccharopolyspora sp. NFXS83]MCX2729154.1 hypothetical protein [Saccharopolyspora sp. NFXS83]
MHVSAPLSSGQQRLRIASQLDGADPACNETLAFALRDPLNREALRRAFPRTVTEVAGQPHEAAELRRADPSEPFDLARAPLARTRLLTAGESAALPRGAELITAELEAR